MLPKVKAQTTCMAFCQTLCICNGHACTLGSACPCILKSDFCQQTFLSDRSWLSG